MKGCGSGGEALTVVGKANSEGMDGVFTARDGTRLAYRRSGTGPALLLLHGTSSDHRRWQPVLPALEEHFTVYNLDRRGRGGSGDAAPYAFAQEFADTVAVVEAIGEPVDVIGHSYGGICALEAAPALGAGIRKMVVYEPPINVTDVPIASAETIDRLEEVLNREGPEAFVETFMRDQVGVPPEALAEMRTRPAWQARIEAAHTVPREMRAVLEYPFAGDRYRRVTQPTLLLVGSESPQVMHAAVRAVAAALPRQETVVLSGQGHVAMDTAPEQFVREVLRFLQTT